MPNILPKPEQCSGCYGMQWSCPSIGMGFITAQQPEGEWSGVLLVAEAAGEQESLAGLPFQGKAGETLDKLLIRGGMQRDQFLIDNTIRCRPPDNQLSGMWYAEDVTNHCAGYLDGTIRTWKPKCIVTLGVTAFKRVIPEVAGQKGVGLLDSKKHKGARGYVFWSEKYQTWVIPTIHPAFIVRGKTAWSQVLIHDIQRGVEIAEQGYAYDQVDYLLDPPVSQAIEWIKGFEQELIKNPDTLLSCDIETPGKDANEEELDLESGSDYIILRCGYSYRNCHGMSIPWGGPYQQVHERLLMAQCVHLWWNGAFDIPRILSQGFQLGGINRDGMDQWHVLNSDLNKSLGFVTPFFCAGQPMWKHFSGDRPAYYNCADADTAGRNSRGTIALLKKHGMWRVYKEFVEELDPVFSAMTKAGMPIDRVKRIESSKKLIAMQTAVRAKIEAIVPVEIKNLTPKLGYVREPEDKTGLQQFVFGGIKNNYCTGCGEKNPKKAHFKSKVSRTCTRCGKKWTTKHVSARKKPNPCEGIGNITKELNPCFGFGLESRLDGETRWARIEPFVASTTGILRYMKYNKHPLLFTGKGEERRPTADEKAINKLRAKYPQDEFYSQILADRELNTIGGRYLGWYDEARDVIEGGFPTDKFSRVHGTFRHSPSTLRSSMVAPNLQNIPRGLDSEVQAWVKEAFVAPSGYLLCERDFSGIEAVLVGLHAGDREFMRLARIDIHSYFTAHNLYRQKLVLASDVPNLAWSDTDLAGALKIIKKRFPKERDIGKRCIHAGDYRVGPTKLHEEYPSWFPKVKDAAAVLKLFYEVFPKINQWHQRICLQVDKTAVFTNSFGHVMRFFSVLDWKKVKGEWEWSYGSDSKRLIASGPQSDAAFIGKRALKACYYNYPNSLAQWLRLFIHDSIMAEVPSKRADEADFIMKYEMEKPIPELILDPAWGFGNCLSIATEPKRGQTWAMMQ